MKNNPKGITLVALVITIIILIILAAVSIKVVTNFSIIEKASEGAEKYAKAQNEEVDEFERLVEKLSISSNTQDENSNLQGNINMEILEDIIQKKIEEELRNKDIEVKLNMYPIGSIYMSTEATNPSELFGGEWESYGEGRTIIGTGQGYEAGKTGGSEIVKLEANNLPNHNHSIPSLTGTAAYVSLTGTFTSRAWKTSWANGVFSISGRGGIDRTEPTGSDVSRHEVTINASHSHSVTTNASNTGNTGTSEPINIQNPYIVTYMWKRVS